MRTVLSVFAGREAEKTANSPCPVCLFTLLNGSIDRHCAFSVKVGSISKETLSGLHIDPGCMSFVVQNVL